MKKMLMTETKGEAEKVQALFEEITKAIADGKKDYDADCYCDETDTFTDHLEFGVDIPRGAIVYVFRDIGGGEAGFQSIQNQGQGQGQRRRRNLPRRLAETRTRTTKEPTP